MTFFRFITQLTTGNITQKATVRKSSGAIFLNQYTLLSKLQEVSFLVWTICRVGEKIPLCASIALQCTLSRIHYFNHRILVKEDEKI